MLIVEQTAVIEAPMEIVMQALNDVERIPSWATVSGTIENVQGSGLGMSYDWCYTVEGLDFKGKSKVIEQTADTLITKTTGDIASIWTITLSRAGKRSTVIRVVVEYTPPNTFVEVLADIAIQQYTSPEVARENMRRFKEMVEERAKVVEERV